MKVLLLSGTSDARRIANELVDDTRFEIIASLAGAIRAPLKMPCETRVGGFGGQAGLAEYILAKKIGAVVDATHPFAARISKNAAVTSKSLKLPHIQMLRPAWQPEVGDNWIMIENEARAATYIPNGSTVFLATGRQTLPAFANLAACRLICRQIDEPQQLFPFPNGEFLVGRPPFSIADEIALFEKLNIDWLVVKNSGANASRSKLDAARQMGMPVAMINRPEQPECERVSTVENVINWLEQVHEKS